MKRLPDKRVIRKATSRLRKKVGGKEPLGWSTPTRRGALPGCRAANRLITVTNGTTLTLEYQYNGDGVLVAQTADGVTPTYVIAVLGLPQVLVETTDGQSTVYLHGHDGSAGPLLLLFRQPACPWSALRVQYGWLE